MDNQLALLLPVIILEFILAITALIHVIFIQIIGPIFYFIFGRGEE